MCLRGFGLGAARLRRLAIGFRLLAPSLLVVGLALGLRLARGGRLPLLLQSLILLALDGNHARVFRRLRRLPRDHDGWFPLFPLQIALGLLQRRLRFPERIRRVLIRTRRLRDLHRVARLVDLDRHFRVRLQLQDIGELLVLAALQQLILRIDQLDLAQRLRPDLVLHHDHVARLRHREVRLCRHDEAEYLQVRGHLQAALASVE